MKLIGLKSSSKMVVEGGFEVRRQGPAATTHQSSPHCLPVMAGELGFEAPSVWLQNSCISHWVSTTPSKELKNSAPTKTGGAGGLDGVRLCNLFNPYSNSLKLVPSQSPDCIHGPEMFSNMSKVTQLESCIARIQTWKTNSKAHLVSLYTLSLCL